MVESCLMTNEKQSAKKHTEKTYENSERYFLPVVQLWATTSHNVTQRSDAKSATLDKEKTLMRRELMLTYDEYVETGLLAVERWLEIKDRQNDSKL